MIEELTLPELGENIPQADILAVLVAAGDVIESDQSVVEVETDKATVAVPAAQGGRVTAVHVKVGDTVKVGQKLLSLEPAEASEEEPEEEPGEELLEGKGRARRDRESAALGEPGAQQGAREMEEELPETRGRGESEGTARRKEEEGEPARKKRTGRRRMPSLAPEGEAEPEEEPAGPAPTQVVAASPSVRRLAREMGVDVRGVAATGPAGRITVEDVKAHARRLLTQPAVGGVPQELPDFSAHGEVEREPMGGVRRQTARHVAQAWAAVPHVTQFDSADVTELHRFRKAQGREFTLTAIAVKIVAGALRAFPRFNASVDLGRQELVIKRYIHVGVAVDTPAGLLVPVVKNADRKGLRQIASELGELAGKARDRKASPDDLSGGTFTVTNLGGLGTTYFTPIVSWPQVAILGMGRAQVQPVYREEELQPRSILPLSLSYDHRALDGADAARFLRWVAEALEHPLLLAMDPPQE